ncbi:putative 15-hydroxyprostaglandin dehydrogenase (nad(+)) protein [Neofusicoccum parvum UCRNP2]|uniref:Indoleamine 2,3-dioxygenase n=1 Tax=Botryosphaeria parva (strain UCR-NP2) TaxID=1287680 RepID=R1GW13_BOTPV|nr:putative 15-hydroxyprostaglandin dehydrogenase (nad(+)) protein [Neofusicoccum parvum UCRNP2]
MLAHQNYGITANFQKLLWAIFSYLKTVWFAFLAGTTLVPSKVAKPGFYEEPKEVSLDDEVNNKLRKQFRDRMTKLLNERVDIAAVEALLSAVDAGNQSAIPRDVYNGFFSCIAMSRHAFRWATIPAVKVAQLEKTIEYPSALIFPWPFFNRYYGFDSLAGNVMSNFIYNWKPGHGIVYKINEGRTEEIMRAEFYFTYMFIETERLALPIYLEIALSLRAHRAGDRAALLASLHRLNTSLRAVMKVFYDNMVAHKLSRDAWQPYVQGFHAYGAGAPGPDGAHAESDGVSANQLPFFHAVDALLGLGTYLTAGEMASAVPVAQRRFSDEVRRQGLRQEVREAGDGEVEALLGGIAKQLRVWRAAHRVRIVPYFDRPAPERMLMTAGKSLLETKGVQSIKGALEYVDLLLRERMYETA